MRIKFLRILPATWASTSLPVSSCTRNRVFARACVTVPLTTNASSFWAIALLKTFPHNNLLLRENITAAVHLRLAGLTDLRFSRQALKSRVSHWLTLLVIDW